VRAALQVRQHPPAQTRPDAARKSAEDGT
jgi:hypothetical protein